MSFFYKNLLPEQIDQMKKFNEELNVFDEHVISVAQKSNVVNYVADLLAALRSGLQWSSLTPDEQDLIMANSHESQWKNYTVRN